MKKLTEETKKTIRELSNSGLPQTEIARKLELSKACVNYWLISDELRDKRRKQAYQSFKNKPLEERKKIYKNRLPYLRDYQKKKYWEDESFREKKKQEQRKRYKKKE